MLAYSVALGGLVVLLAASVSALREAIRQRVGVRGVLVTVGTAAFALLGIWGLLV